MKPLRHLLFLQLGRPCRRFALAFWLGCLGLALAGQGAGGKQILVLTSYGDGRPGVVALLQGFRAALNRGGLSVEQLFTENLDLERAKDPAFRRSLAATLRLK